MASLPDGVYDCIVVDVDDDEENSTRITFTVTAGPHKSETFALRAASMTRDAIDLLGLPATVEVTAGEPRVRW